MDESPFVPDSAPPAVVDWGSKQSSARGTVDVFDIIREYAAHEDKTEKGSQRGYSLLSELRERVVKNTTVNSVVNSSNSGLIVDRQSIQDGLALLREMFIFPSFRFTPTEEHECLRGEPYPLTLEVMEAVSAAGRKRSDWDETNDMAPILRQMSQALGPIKHAPLQPLGPITRVTPEQRAAALGVPVTVQKPWPPRPPAPGPSPFHRSTRRL